MASTLEVVISAVDRFTGTANRVIGTLNRMDSSAGRVGKGVGQLGLGLGRVGLIAAGAAAGGIVAVAKSTANWETALAGVNKTMDLTPAQLQAIGAEIRNLATTELPMSADAIAALVEQAGALGIAQSDVVEFARVAATIGVTTNVTAEQAATSLGVMRNLFGLSKTDFERFASTLVDLGNKGASTEAQIITFTERLAGAGATVGLTADQVLALASAMANVNILPEAGGTAMSRVLIDMAKFSVAGGKELKTLAKVTGMTGKEFKKAFRDDAAGTLEQFVDSLSELNRDQRIKVLGALGWDDRRVMDVLLRLAEAEKEQNNLTDALNIGEEAWDNNTAAAEEAQKRYETLASRFQILKNQGREAMLLIGEGMMPSLKRATERIGKLLSDPAFKDDLRSLGRDIGSMIDSINWEKVKDGAKTLLGIVKEIWGVMSKIPPEAIASFAGFLTLNKLSGGLIAQGISNIFGGLGGAASRGIASKIPGIGSIFAQPVYVVNWPPGIGGGGGINPLAGAGAAGLGVGSITLLAALIPTAIAMVGLELAKMGPEGWSEEPLRKVLEDPTTPAAVGGAKGSYGKGGFKKVGPDRVVPKPLPTVPERPGSAYDANLNQQASELTRIRQLMHTLPDRMPKLPAKLQVNVRVVSPVNVRVNNTGTQSAVWVRRRNNQTFVDRRVNLRDDQV